MGAAQSGPKVTAQDKAILEMKLQRDKLRIYRKKSQRILDQEQQIALHWLRTGDRSRALTALRRRKFQESLLQRTDGQLEVLENLVANVEFAQIEKDVLYGLKQGNEVLRQIHAEMNVESVQKLMEETAEAVQYQKEIDEMLMSTMTVEEEESVQAELAQLQAEVILAAPEAATDKPVALPRVPENEPVPITAPEPERRPEATESNSDRIALPA
ncbi:Vacuolar protein sorting-associated protein 20 [Tulasnella sp. 403]|nr:Vacuolar protein sorting-associated protein 20 [Tulasnella sp. 403]